MSDAFVAHGNRWASLGQKVVVTVDPDAETLTLRAPFYRRTLRLADITGIEVHDDDGRNRGVVNWFVTGRARSTRGVRLSTGGDGATRHRDGRRSSVRRGH